MENHIVVIGPPRSGTHFVASEIAKHTGLKYIGEQSALWSDLVTGSDDHYDVATVTSARKIDAARHKLLELSGGQAFVEKTPANCLRIELVRKVLPDAKIVFVIRDGRSCTISACKKLRGDSRKITSGSTEYNIGKWLRHIVKYKARKYREYFSLSGFARDLQLLLWRVLLRKKLWGPKFIGWKNARKSKSDFEYAALQWRECASSILNYMERKDNHSNYYLFHYENFIENPSYFLSKLDQPYWRDEVKTAQEAPENYSTELSSAVEILREPLLRFNYIEPQEI